MRHTHTHTFTSSLKTLTLRLIKGWHLPLVAAFMLLVGVGCAALLYGHTATATAASAAPSLGTAQSFAVLGGSAVTNTGLTNVTGDLGVSPGTAITGFPPGIVTGGIIRANDAVAMQAQNDVTTAYNALAGLACNTVLTGTDLGGLTLTPGVYCFTSSAQLTGALTLDAQGNPNALFIFQIASTLITASNSSVQVINGGQGCNVFFQVGSSATLGTGTAFVGNILALSSITLNTGASLSGRALARTGAVTLDTNAVAVANCAPPVPPTLGKAFSPATINAGGVSTLTITLSNPNTCAATLTASLTDTLPAGVVIAAAPNAANTCGGVVTAAAGGSTVTLTGGAIPAGAPGTCTVTVNVTAALGGSYVNMLPAGALQTSNGNNNSPAVATLTVVPPTGPPLLGKAFNPATINAGGVSTLTITLSNPNLAPATLSAPLTDTLPAGVVIAPIPNANTTCGVGVVTAIAGGNTVTLTGGAIPGGAPGMCTVTVNVTAPLAGNYLNTLPAGALQTSNGNNAAPAIATLTVVQPLFTAPVLGKAFSPATINAGGVSTLTITLSNPNLAPATLSAPLTDTLPAGVVIAAVPNAANTCGGVVTAAAGGNTVTLTGGAIPGGSPGMCTVTVNVTAALGGSYLNTLPAGALQTNNGNNAAPAIATLIVVPPNPGPPLLSKAFSPATINAGGVSTLTITLTNPNLAPATLTAPLTDTLPPGVLIAPVPNAGTTCGNGMVTANAGTNMVTLAMGAIIPGGTPGACTVTVNVTAALAGNYLNTLAAGALQTSNGNNAAPAIATLTVIAVPIDVCIVKTGSALVAIETSQFTYTLSVVNFGPGAATSVTVTDILPAGVTLVSATPSQGACSGAATIICNLGNLASQATATIRLVVTLPMKSAGSVFCNTATITSNQVEIAPANNTSTLCVPVEKVPPGPGPNLPPTSQVSDTKPGSVLIFPYYTSDASNPNRTNTRISITNVENRWQACVHLFFVDGVSCSVADSSLCLTPNQTTSFLMSDLDPGVSGYLIAVLVDCQTGCPLNINTLIGDAYVKLASGHAANLGAEAIAGLPGVRALCDSNSSTAELRFDGVMYNQLPRVLALDNLGSRADGNDTLLVVNRIGGNLTASAATIGSLFGLLYDDAEAAYSFNFSAASCQLRNTLSDSSPRLVPRLTTIIPAGRSGWLKLWGAADVGLLGAALNFNPNTGSNAGAFNQGHNLHKLTLTSAASLTIPVFPPSC